MGAVYRVADWADLNLSYERGNTPGCLALTLRTTLSTCARVRGITRNRPGKRHTGETWTIPLGGEPAHRA